MLNNSNENLGQSQPALKISGLRSPVMSADFIEVKSNWLLALLAAFGMLIAGAAVCLHYWQH